MSFGFGGWAISKTCFDYIRELLPGGKVILELGSGEGTAELAKYYRMYSIENQKEWINKYDSTYIYAPIKKYVNVKLPHVTLYKPQNQKECDKVIELINEKNK